MDVRVGESAEHFRKELLEEFVVFRQNGIDGSEIVQRFAIFIMASSQEIWNAWAPRLRVTYFENVNNR